MKTAACLLLLLVAACGDDGVATPDGSVDAGPDSGPDAGTDAGPADAGPPWPADLPDLADLGDRRGYTLARTIVHLHSPLSHDACDGEGWVDGALADPECLQHLRTAFCTLNIDAAYLTDHAPHMNEVDFAQALWIEPGDEEVRDTAGELVANRMTCPSGHKVLVTVGSENPLMPVSLKHHVGGLTDPDMLEMAYDADGPDAVASFHDAGALVFQNHTEGRPLDELRDLGLDGVEIYNTHANIDPRIRENDLGLEPTSFISTLILFTVRGNMLPPDLAVMSFLEENQVDLDKWDTLLVEGQRLTGIAGNDAHENSFPQLFTDGERGDSYRRLMHWSSNHLLVTEVSVDGVDEALRAGRLYVAFEAFGTPEGFDFRAESGETVVEMGGDADLGAELVVVLPHLPADFPQDPEPVLTARLVRSEAGGAVEVATATEGELRYTPTEPGVYRAEVRIFPEHTRPFLHRFADRLLREYPWVYSNPIHVRAP